MANNLQDTNAAVTQLTKLVNELKQSFADLNAETKKTATSQEDLQKKTTAGKTATEKLSATEKERINLLKQMEKATDKEAVANEELRLQLQTQKKTNKELAKEKQGLIGAYQKESKRLTELRNKYKDLAVQGKANTKEAKALYKELTTLDKNLKQVDASVGQNQRSVGNYKKALDSLKLGYLAALGIITTFAKGLQKVNKITVEFNKQVGKTAAQLSTTREEAEKLAKYIRVLAAVYDEDFNDVLKSATILQKEFGITGNEALNLINQGFEKGANVNGEFLELLKEYPAQLKTVGLNAKQAIAFITQSERAGVFSDKGLDAIKEAGIRLRELTPATESALEAIGLSADVIQKQLISGEKTLFEITQDVSRKLSELPPQSKKVGTAIADIFGGPGEDVGLRFLTTLKDIDLELGNIETSLTDSEVASNNLKKTWQEFIDVALKSGGVVDKAVIGIKNQITKNLDIVKGVFQGIDGVLKDNLTPTVENYIKKLKEENSQQDVVVKLAQLYESSLVTIEDLESKASKARGKKKRELEREAQILIVRNDIIQENIDLINDQVKAEIAAAKKKKQAGIDYQNERAKIAEGTQLKIIEGEKAIINNLNSNLNEEAGIIKIKERYDKEYYEQKKKLADEAAESELEGQRAVAEQIASLKQTAATSAEKILLDQLNSRLDNELAAFEAKQDKEAELLKEKLDKGVITQAQYDEKMTKLEKETRKKQHEAEKESALYSIAINTIAGIARALIDYAYPYNLIVGGLVAAEGAIQYAAVQSEPMPAYKLGTPSGGHPKDGPAIYGEAGSELVTLPDGQSFLTPDTATKGWLPRGAEVFSAQSPETKAAKYGGITPDLYIAEQKKTRRSIDKMIKQNNMIIIDRSKSDLTIKRIKW